MRHARVWWMVALGLALWACDDAALEDNPGLEAGADQGVSVDGGGGLDPDDGRPAPDRGVPPGGICAPGETRCVDGLLRTCIDDATGWLVERCGEASLCQDGACVDLVCSPGARRCTDDGQVEACLVDGSGYGDATACADDSTCLDGACVGRICTPGELACGERVALVCNADGLTWGRTPCADGEVCLDGACAPPPMGGVNCAPGEVLCGPAGRLACSEDGQRYVETPCPEGQACFQGGCVACVRDADCADGGVCAEGACVPPPLRVALDGLPAGQVGVDYLAPLVAEFGTPPYTWAVDGALPAGVALDFEGTSLVGRPEAAGAFPITLTVTDDAGAEASAALTLTVVGDGLQITTERLPNAEEGQAYEQALGALGGEGRYGWFLVEGALPMGMALTGEGVIQGVPAEVGAFDLTVRVVDAARPPNFTEKAFTLTVEIAPLRIIADQILELFVTRIVTLPLITVVPNLPIPYRAELQARGGLRPYTWSEVELPAGLRGFIPQSGIPDGLALGEDGVLAGAVVDPAQIVELQIPFTQITLTGFFFFAEVRDSQDPAASQQAIFVLPTLPLGN